MNDARQLIILYTSNNIPFKEYKRIDSPAYKYALSIPTSTPSLYIPSTVYHRPIFYYS